MKIGAALLTNSAEELVKQVKDANVCDFMQIDVMDGSFTPEQTVWVDAVKKAISKAKIPVEIHLMANDVESKIDMFLDLKVSTIIFHYEGAHEHEALIAKIKASKKKVGVAIKLGTSATKLRNLIPQLDQVLVYCTDKIGTQGPKFSILATRNVAIVREYDRKIAIGLDGGINPTNARLCRTLGATQCVSGSYLQKNNYSKEVLKQFRDA